MREHKIRVTLFPPGGALEADLNQKAWGYETWLTIDPATAHLIPEAVAREQLVIPVARQGAILTVAMLHPNDLETQARLRQITGLRMRPVAAEGEEIRSLIAAVYASPQAVG